MTDEQLLELLVTEEDRLPREAVDEILRRRERLRAPLEEICRREKFWCDDSGHFWQPVHASFILAAMRDPSALPALLDAMRWANIYDVDWVCEPMPSMLAAAGEEGVPLLKERLLETAAPKYDKAIVVEALELLASAHPDVKEDVLDCIRRVFHDDNEVLFVRDMAAYGILCFAPPSDRDVLYKWVEKMDEESSLPLFGVRCVEEAYEKGGLEQSPRDWLDFYDADEIAYRQRRWERERREDADEDDDGPEDHPSPPVSEKVKVGRNAPCPCGSGKKYKRCCGRTQQ